MKKLYAKRYSDNKEFVVVKYTHNPIEIEISVWCDGWYGRHIVGTDCKIYFK